MLAWVTVVGNGLAGVHAFAAWRVARLRGRPLWITVIAAQAILAVQGTVGVLLESDSAIAAPRIHMFYGFVGLIVVALAYSYRLSMRGRLEVFYGAVGLFIMGIGIRAMLTA